MERTLEAASPEFVPALEQFAANLKQEEEKEKISNEG